MATETIPTTTESIGASAAKKSVSIWVLYLERFRKHRLGRVGFWILAILYATALFAPMISPKSMTWTDKTKPYHPPTRITWIDRSDGSSRFRPFVYEQAQVNIAFREYAIVPQRALRIVAVPDAPELPSFRSISWDRDANVRVTEVLREFRAQYRIAADSDAYREIERNLRELTRNGEADETRELSIEVPRSEGTLDVTVRLVSGNKNYLQLFGRGSPYRFFGIRMERRILTSPTEGYFALGTDRLGRDNLSRLFFGGRISLSVGLLGVAISFTIGIIVGGIAGYAGGRIDAVLMRLVEVMQSVPTIYLLFALRAAFPPNLTSVQVYLLIVVILSLTAWAGLARIIRGLVLSIKTEEYVLAARSLGIGHMAVIMRHILPNTLSLVIVQASLSVPGYILGESALSLLGLGIQEPQSSWGLMLAAGRNFRVVSQFPWMLIPGVFIFLAILAWNFFGDGIRDAVDPRGIIR